MIENDRPKGVLLVNLGTPDSYNVNDVKKYLIQFLNDKNIIPGSPFKRKLLVNYIIVPKRASKSAQAYKRIWSEKGSPLRYIMQELAESLSSNINLPVEVGMRYGNPSIFEALRRLSDCGVKDVILVPMFPHKTLSTHITVMEEFRKEFDKFPDLRFKEIKPLSLIDDYIDAVVKTVKNVVEIKTLKEIPQLQAETVEVDLFSEDMPVETPEPKFEEIIEKKEFDHYVISYHGIPVSHIHMLADHKECEFDDSCMIKGLNYKCKDSCYWNQCYLMSKKIAQKLKLNIKDCTVAFQSRMGKDPWLEPDLKDVLADLASKGKKKILIISASFTVDCLETLEELPETCRNYFVANGGKEFEIVPALNADPEWVETLSEIISKSSNYNS